MQKSPLDESLRIVRCRCDTWPSESRLSCNFFWPFATKREKIIELVNDSKM
jgi:hypothetical protein